MFCVLCSNPIIDCLLKLTALTGMMQQEAEYKVGPS
jgi:hypothetical protein